jgi:hypothetical protein
MAGRKDKNTVEYFPHYCTGGKTLYIIENKFGNNGYAVLFKTFELLGSNDHHYIDCRNPDIWEFVQAKMKLLSTELKQIYDTLAITGTIHKELWDHKVIWSPNFIKNVEEVYKRRNTKCLQFSDLCTQLSIKCKHKYDLYGNPVNGNTHSRVERSKEENNRVENSREKETKLEVIPEKEPEYTPEQLEGFRKEIDKMPF